jgi:hypothetical protein
MVDIFVVKKPILHHLPKRYDLVRFSDESGVRRTGIVIGLPGEEIEVVDGVVVVNGLPDIGDAPGGIILSGDWPVTSAGAYSLLIATINLGKIDKVYRSSLDNLIGKVSRVL